jgi:hypothetical protein
MEVEIKFSLFLAASSTIVPRIDTTILLIDEITGYLHHGKIFC